MQLQPRTSYRVVISFIYQSIMNMNSINYNEISDTDLFREIIKSFEPVEEALSKLTAIEGVKGE